MPENMNSVGVHSENCAHCPDRQNAYCRCYDTFLDEQAGSYVPYYDCTADDDERYA